MQKYDFDQIRKIGFTTLSNALIKNYAKIGLTDTQFIIVLQLEMFAQEQNFLPDQSLIAMQTNLSKADIGIGLQSLIEQEIIEIVQSTDSDNRIQNQYSLSPLYQKLIAYLNENVPLSTSTDKTITPDNSDDTFSSLMRQFEIEFGRLLGPMEREMIQNWLSIDHYNEEIIKLALREAVLAQVYNFKYIDRILLNWQRMNLKTVSQVQRYLKN